MIWNTLLEPNVTLDDTVLSLTPAMVTRYGLKGLILDVDETLVPTSVSAISGDLLSWLDQFRPEVAICLVSNNLNEPRIRQIAETLNVPYLFAAGKPSRRKLRQALATMKLTPTEVGMVGDRIFTDVLAGNRLGLFTILVEPMMDDQGQTWKHWLRLAEIRLFQTLQRMIH